MSKTRLTARRNRELKALKYRKVPQTETQDMPEVRDWDGAVRGRFYRPVKKAISLRLDADVLAWFKAHNEKYQSKINEVLREYMRRHP
jgi:uncharacterized protein (DUF4415 family)